MKKLALVVQQPESAELPPELSAELSQYARQRVLDGFGLGEGATNGVLNEESPVEVGALVN